MATVRETSTVLAAAADSQAEAMAETFLKLFSSFPSFHPQQSSSPFTPLSQRRTKVPSAPPAERVLPGRSRSRGSAHPGHFSELLENGCGKMEFSVGRPGLFRALVSGVIHV